MLSDEIKKEIDEEISHMPYKQAACIEALKAVQRRHRYVSDEHLRDVAEYLEMSAEEVDSVATFYNLVFRKPVGRHVILLCDSVSCYILGYKTILDVLKEKLGIELGDTTEDDRFTLLTIPCLGTCDRAPAMMIDNDLHRDLTTEKIDNILDQYK